MLLWTAAILAALGLAWFIGAVVVPVWQTREALSRSRRLANSTVHTFERLGGPRAAARKLALFLRMPRWCRQERSQGGTVDGGIEAVFLLAGCGEPGGKALARALDHRDTAIREAAANIIMGMGWEQPEAAQALIRKANDPAMNWCAVKLLFESSPPPPAAVPVLVEALQSPAENIRCEAANALGNLGPPAQAAIPALEKALTDPQQSVRAAAAEALKKIRAGGSR
jgi:hypothetical protein